MPALFHVTNCQGHKGYIAGNGDELTKGEAINAAYRGHESTYQEELERRVKLWSVTNDVWPHEPGIERF